MSSTIIGFFDDRDQAEKARSRLIDIGLVERDINIFSSDSEMGLTDTNKSVAGEPSFGQRVKHFFTHLGDWQDTDDAQYYAEGMRRGGYTLSVIADEAYIDRVSDILNECGAVDIDRRGQYYKESGFSQYDFNAAPYSRDQSLQERNLYTDWEKNRFADQNKEQVIPVIEEKVNVGKRAVEKGRVRIYTRVTETPIDQELRLRDERVEVQRTPVDRPVQATDMGAFKEGEIELRETTEEAVVNKEARVVEEVRVRQEAGEHVEQIHETARRTDVEVDRTGSNERISKSRSKNKDLNP